MEIFHSARADTIISNFLDTVKFILNKIIFHFSYEPIVTVENLE